MKTSYINRLNNLKYLLLTLSLLMLISILGAYDVGDYRTKWAWGYLDDANAWQLWNGLTWVNAATPPPSPFYKTIYMNHTLYFNDDLTLASGAKIKMAAGTSLEYCDCGPTLIVEDGATVDMARIYVNKNGTLINYGIIQAQDNIQASLKLEQGDHVSGRSFLENYGTIDMSDNHRIDNSFEIGGHARIISAKNAAVLLRGSLKVAPYAEAEIKIANEGGFLSDLTSSAAIRHSGPTPAIGHIYFTFNGNSPQVMNIPEGLIVASVTIDNPTKVTLNSNFQVYSWLLQDSYPGGWVTVKSGSTLDVQGYVIQATGEWNGKATFTLEPGATIVTQHPEGISSESFHDRIIKGSIQMNITSYSSGGNYTYNGTGVQHTGCFKTTPLYNTVNNLTADDSNGLTQLIFCLDGIHISGTATGNDKFNGNYTLPVTLANLLVQQSPSGYPQVNWLTASETNCLGFYIWRATDTNLDSAMRVSSLILAANTSNGAAYTWTDNELYEGGTYYYWLEDIAFDQQTQFHGPRSITIGFLGNYQAPEITQPTGIKMAYPNPFNPSTTLSYYLEEAGQVEISIFNQRGQLVDRISLSRQEKGLHKLSWNANALRLSSGIYFARFSSGRHTNSIKLVLSK